MSSTNYQPLDVDGGEHRDEGAKWIDSYLASGQLRLVYYAVAVIAIMVSFTIGECCSGMVAVRYSNLMFGDFLESFVAVPLVFLVMCVFITHMCDILWDVLSVPPLLLFRAICITIGVPYNKAMHGALLALLEFYPLASAIHAGAYNEWSLAVMLPGYATGGLTICLILMVLLIIGKVIVRCQLGWHKVEAVKQKLAQHGFFDDSLELTREITQCKTLDQDSHTPAWRKQRAAACLGISAFLLVASYFWIKETKIVIGGFVALFAVMLLLWRAAEDVAPRFLGNTYIIMLCVYLVFSVLLGGVFDILDMNGKSHKADNYFEAPASGVGVQQGGAANSSSYPVCSMRWGEGAEDSQLNIFDFFVLQQAMYVHEPEIIKYKVANATEHTDLADVQIEEIQNYTEIARYAVFNFSTAKKVVLAIRGTQMEDDMLADAQMLGNAAVLDAVTKIIPIEALVPQSVIRLALQVFDIGRWFGSRPAAYEPHVKKARELKARCEEEGCEVFITGHSLGGVIAAIVGGEVGVQSVAFSPPGERLSLLRFGMTHDVQIFSTLTAIIPSTDIVPQIDGQVGNVQPIACNGLSALACHGPFSTFCELVRGCGGDPRGRQVPAKIRARCEGQWAASWLSHNL